jgi:uncharacterized protein (TIGR04255 family)
MATEHASLFPWTQRVFYEKAPLIEVVSQLRFPQILRIEGQPPAEFQERIRDKFPLLEKATSPLLPQLQQIPLPAEIMQALGSQGALSYLFFTEDRTSTVTLAPDSIALSTKTYRQWEEFLTLLRAPLGALIDVYQPSFFQRVGLRYIDAIQREALGLGNRPWSQLLRPAILGELAVPEFEKNLESVGRQIRIRMPDGTGSIFLRHGLAYVQGRPELSYMIDFDFFNERRTEVRDAEGLLSRFHESAGRAFRWCITDSLHDALGPRAIDST